MSEHTLESWCVSKSECLNCGYEWIAFHPLAADNLECDKCSSHDTVRFDVEEGETE